MIMDKLEFEKLYYKDKLSLRQVAKRMNTNASTLRYYMKVHWGLKSRTKSESIKLSYTEGRRDIYGVNNPNYKDGKQVDAGNGRRWSRYGITEFVFNNMLINQNYRCAICMLKFNDNTPNIDHCHKTEKVRGLLCSNCNRGIGLLKDNTTIISNAIKYLNKEI
tara:strand:+ start:10 stop:498 length:489 start_codon:yes stop_codon:yes gene_type:complete